MIKFKEFNMRERNEILSLATKCLEELSAQFLIDHFHKTYRTRFENGKTITDKIIDKYYPNCSEQFRDTVHSILIENIFAFEGVQDNLDNYNDEKEELREKFRDFFIFHNDANKITTSVDQYFDEWYDKRFPRT